MSRELPGLNKLIACGIDVLSAAEHQIMESLEINMMLPNARSFGPENWGHTTWTSVIDIFGYPLHCTIGTVE